MKKPNILIATTIVMVMGTTFTFLGFPSAFAQYTGGATGASTLEEQLKLAQEKVSNAGQQGAYGSGTSFVSTDTTQTAIFIGVLVAIFGGVAAAFFAMSRRKEPAR